MSPPACEVLAVTNAKPARGSRGASDAPHVPEPTEATVPAQEGRDRPTSWKEGARRTLEVNPLRATAPSPGGQSAVPSNGAVGEPASAHLRSPARGQGRRLAPPPSSRDLRVGIRGRATRSRRVASLVWPLRPLSMGPCVRGTPARGCWGRSHARPTRGASGNPELRKGPDRRRQPLPPRPSALRAKYLRRAAPGSSSRHFREGLRASVTDRTTRIPAAQTLGQRRTRAKRGPWTCARRGRAGRAARAHLATPPALCPRPRALRNQGSPRPRPHR